MNRIIIIIMLSQILLLKASSQTVNTTMPEYYRQDKSFNNALYQIIRSAGLADSYDTGEDGMETISFAVIDLTTSKPTIGGVNMDNFIYPASVYKMYVAMEVLKQVREGKYSLYDNYIVQSPNDIDRSSEIRWDPRPLLKNGDTVTIDYLLDLMITRSDNSASNCMIDLVGRENINQTMHAYGWQGSEVTRKFLPRKFEDPGYDTIAGTMTSALHAADFIYKMSINELVDPWVSQQLKVLLGRQLDTTKLRTGLAPGAMFYHKSGWWSYFTNDVGLVDDGEVKYVIALFTPVKEMEVRPKMKEVSARVYELMQRRYHNRKKNKD